MKALHLVQDCGVGVGSVNVALPWRTPNTTKYNTRTTIRVRATSNVMRPNGTPVIKRPRTTLTKADRTESRIASGCTKRVEMNDCNKTIFKRIGGTKARTVPEGRKERFLESPPPGLPWWDNCSAAAWRIVSFAPQTTLTLA